MSENISAYTPPETVCGAAAIVPQIRRKIKSAVQLGATAQPSVPRTKTVKVQKRTGLLPTVSLKGLQTKGPTQYPIKKIAVGKTFWPSPSRPKSCMIVGTALLGKEDDTPLLSTTISPTTALYIFFFYSGCQSWIISIGRVFHEDEAYKRPVGWVYGRVF
jgi:hypothetical protein